MIFRSTPRRACWPIACGLAIAATALMEPAAQAAPSVCDAVAGNLISNCGFESGAVAQSALGFTSAYSYTSNLVPAGTFYIGNNPSTYNGYFPAFQNGARSPLPNSGGYQMIVNGASTPVTVWAQSGISVTPNTNYYFSVYVQSVTDISPPVLHFSANGLQLGSTFTASATTGVEQQFVASWNSGSSTSVDLSLYDADTASSGNDFALDDFVFSETAPSGGTSVGGTGTTGGSAAVPEPTSLVVLAAGLLGLAQRRRRGRDMA